MQTIVDKIADRAAIKSLKNAYDLADSAEIVKSSGRIGIATALLVLACEELSKARHYRSISYGIITTDESNIGTTYVFSPKVMREHELKHMDSIGSSLATLVGKVMDKNRDRIEEIMGDTKIDFPDGRQPSEEVQKKFETLTKELFDNDEEYQREFLKLKSLLLRMEELKERGLYVDVNGKDVLSPDDIKEEEYMTLKKHFNELVLQSGPFIDGSMVSKFADFSMRYLSKAAQRQKKSMFDNYKRGSIRRSSKP